LKKKKKKSGADHRAAFADAFAAYVRPDEKDDKTRARMLKAFSEFLTGEGIGMEKTRHFELLAKMTEFAGPVRGGKPRMAKGPRGK
jgi:hypothetical protein